MFPARFGRKMLSILHPHPVSHPPKLGVSKIEVPRVPLAPDVNVVACPGEVCPRCFRLRGYGRQKPSFPTVTSQRAAICRLLMRLVCRAPSSCCYLFGTRAGRLGWIIDFRWWYSEGDFCCFRLQQREWLLVSEEMARAYGEETYQSLPYTCGQG